MAAVSKSVKTESGRTILIPSFLPFRCWKSSRVGPQILPTRRPIVTRMELPVQSSGCSLRRPSARFRFRGRFTGGGTGAHLQ